LGGRTDGAFALDLHFSHPVELSGPRADHGWPGDARS
jgi:hypothetical protein